MNCLQCLMPVVVWVVVAVVGQVDAQVLLPGSCPKIPPMKNFEPNKVRVLCPGCRSRLIVINQCINILPDCDSITVHST